MPNRRDRDGEWGNGAIVAVIAAQKSLSKSSIVSFSENSKANRIETMKGPAESGQICSVGRRKVAKKIAKNKRCYANTLRPCSRMLLLRG